MYFHQLKKEEIDDILSYLELHTSQWGWALQQQRGFGRGDVRGGERSAGSPKQGVFFCPSQACGPFHGPLDARTLRQVGPQNSRASPDRDIFSRYDYVLSNVRIMCLYQYWQMTYRYALQPNMMREYHLVDRTSVRSIGYPKGAQVLMNPGPIQGSWT